MFINYVGNLSMMSNVVKNFDILTTSLNVIIILMIKLFSNPYLAKFFDISTKSFFYEEIRLNYYFFMERMILLIIVYFC